MGFSINCSSGLLLGQQTGDNKISGDLQRLVLSTHTHTYCTVNTIDCVNVLMRTYSVHVNFMNCNQNFDNATVIFSHRSTAR